jgi:cellulose synthase/poly-beta-1,6-N-acetylglucosamine synthase-like glycosyltransferase
VTSAGKDRLGLNPPLLGAVLHRRAALEDVGGFSGDGPGEDVRLSAALTRAGWSTRFVADAVVENPVAAGWHDYWRQHLRWARNVMRAGRSHSEVAGTPTPDWRRTPVASKAEGLIAALGYVDRVAFLAAISLAMIGLVSAWVPIAYLAGVALTVAAAILRRARAREIPLYALAAIACFAVDIAASVTAVAKELMARPHVWRTDRSRQPASPISPEL